MPSGPKRPNFPPEPDPRELYEEAMRGERWTMWIDDTRSDVGSLDPSRHTLVGVIVAPDRFRHVSERLIGVIQELQRVSGVGYAHFRHLFAGKGPYRGKLNQDARLWVLNEFARIIREFSLPIIARQTDSQTVQAAIEIMPPEVLRVLAPATRQPNVINVREPKWQAYIELLVVGRDWIGTQDESPKVSVFADREPGKLEAYYTKHLLGMGPGGSPKPMPPLDAYDPPFVYHVNAKDWPFMQLADFAAWTFSRFERIVHTKLPWQSPVAAHEHTVHWDSSVFSVLAKLVPNFHNYTPLDLGQIATAAKTLPYQIGQVHFVEPDGSLRAEMMIHRTVDLSRFSTPDPLENPPPPAPGTESEDG